MLDLALFRNHRFSTGALTLIALYFAGLGSYFLYTQHLQFVLGYSALKAGVCTLPFAPALVVGSLLTPRLSMRFGAGRVAAFGLGVVVIGLLLRATATSTSPVSLLLVSLALIGFGVGCTVAPSTTAIMGGIRPDQAGVGAAMNDVARQLGASLGVAVLGSVMASGFHRALADGPASSVVDPSTLAASHESIGAALRVAAGLDEPQRSALVQGAREAFVSGANHAELVAAAVAVAGAILAWRWLGERPTREVADAMAAPVAGVPTPVATGATFAEDAGAS